MSVNSISLRAGRLSVKDPRREHQTVQLTIAVHLLGVLLLGGCAAGGLGPLPTDSVVPTATGQLSELDKFRAACASGLPVDWRPAQVDYPKALTASVGRSFIYEAAVDARDARPPAGQVIEIDVGTAGMKQVAVRCRLAARLVPSSDVLKIDPEGNEWAYRDFTATGVVQWAWNVTPTKPVDQKLTLVVRPAVDVSLPEGAPQNSYGGGGNSEIRVFTDVSVQGTLIEKVSYWFDTQWPLVLTIGGLVGAALAGLLVWYFGIRQKWKNRNT